MTEAPMRRLRYAEGPTTEVSRVIAASPADLWEHVTDINLSAKFSTEFQGAEWLDGATEPALGARFRGSNEHPAVGSWQVECTIVEYEPERAVGWAVQDPDDPAARWRFTLEAVDGGTRVTQWCQLGPGRSGLTPAIKRLPEREHDIIERRLGEHAANMERNLDGLAGLVEAR
ncbi:MAG: SRPBCC family protein [Ilumatobacter sp.]|uniref:SRPBCC family protein n=1 Tax=Ilumatobacter sp. TaxID=1967498 RepID=UPI00391AD35C